MERLLRIGFVRVGNWALAGESIDYVLEQHREKNNLLYAFSVDGEIKYIGKTTKMLFQRLGFYKKPGARQSTNIRVNATIKTELQNDHIVDIFVLVDNGLLSFGGYHINLAAGIEDSLIAAIQPPWNLRGVNTAERINDEIINDEPDNEEQQNLLLQDAVLAPVITEVTLGQSYYSKGFFNISKAQSDYIGANNDNINIRLDNGEVIIGYINRDANKSNAPRIMGGVALRNWIQAHFRLNDVMKIEIFDPHTINIPIPLQPE